MELDIWQHPRGRLSFAQIKDAETSTLQLPSTRVEELDDSQALVPSGGTSEVQSTTIIAQPMSNEALATPIVPSPSMTPQSIKLVSLST